ncbi:HAD family hydrolase [Burkholderia cenocepacia]|uniref:HAD family hydrolase n=1 Tax=Burkholderia cenocepacia TaxID=95486 RepID=UPI0024B83F76|nr:HAD family hydrolase [Burkholderia cenocepacia]MDI9676903.1 HAD family hydrolase [Burkholderia cenocepacia]
MRKKALITDIDNTLFDWFSMWYASFSAMIQAVATTTGIPMQTLLDEAKAIHQRYGTSEYAFLLEELPSVSALFESEAKARESLAGAIEQYRLHRDAALKLYPGVGDTLRCLKEQGVLLIGFSESKLFYSTYRIAKLDLDGVLDWLYCPEDHEIPHGRIHTRNPLHITQTSELHGQFKKPDPHILTEIMSERGLSAGECVYVGDSKTKDIVMAIDAGVDAVWLQSGTSHLTGTDSAYDLLRRVTHWTDKEVQKEREFAENRREIDDSLFSTIESYSELLKIFEGDV